MELVQMLHFSMILQVSEPHLSKAVILGMDACWVASGIPCGDCGACSEVCRLSPGGCCGQSRQPENASDVFNKCFSCPSVKCTSMAQQKRFLSLSRPNSLFLARGPHRLSSGPSATFQACFLASCIQDFPSFGTM